MVQVCFCIYLETIKTYKLSSVCTKTAFGLEFKQCSEDFMFHDNERFMFTFIYEFSLLIQTSLPQNNGETRKEIKPASKNFPVLHQQRQMYKNSLTSAFIGLVFKFHSSTQQCFGIFFADFWSSLCFFYPTIIILKQILQHNLYIVL